MRRYKHRRSDAGRSSSTTSSTCRPAIVRVKVGGGLAGHNGLRSDQVSTSSTQDFVRVRIGVGKPPSKEHGADHVLSKRAEAPSASARRGRGRGRRRRRADHRRGRRCRDAASTTPRLNPSSADRRRGRYPRWPLRSASLPPLLRDEPALTRGPRRAGRPVGGRRGRPGRSRSPRWPAVTSSRPLVVACPTGTMAGQLADDLAPVPAGRRGRAVPGLGDAAVRAGQPERGDDGPAARGAVAAARPGALPGGDRRRRAGAAAAPRARTPPTSSRSSCARATSIDPDELRRRRWSSFGYRREELVEHRGEVARRGAIIDVFPSTGRRAGPHRPVGRRGRPADRVQRQRPALDRRPRRGADLPGPRAAPDRRGAGPGRRARRRRAVGPRAVGAPRRGRRCSTAWRAGCRGSSTTSTLLTDVLPDAGQGRARRAAADARPGRSTCSPRRTTWPGRWRRRGRATPTSTFPRLHAEPDRLLAERQRDRGRSTPRPSRPTRRSCRRRAGGRSSATATGSSTG